jgi:antitoxin component YwqK of YwqJK toxin-antitoxin module
MVLVVMSGCDLTNPVAPTGAGDSTLPTHSSSETHSATNPTNAPSIDSSLPEDAVLQEDGSYIAVQYVNALNNEVEQNKAESILTTVYEPNGKVRSQELVNIKTGVLRQSQTFTYENGILVCAMSKYFDKNGKIRLHFDEYFDANGMTIKRVDYDNKGEPEKITEYDHFENGNIRLEKLFYGNGTVASVTEYDQDKKILSSKRWHLNGVLSEECTYSDGILITQTIFDTNGEKTNYLEYWLNGSIKIQLSKGFFLNGELIPGQVIYEFYENGTPEHDLTYWPDGTIYSESYYYPSGNTKKCYLNDPSNSHNPEYYAEFRDGDVEPYTGWNVIDGEKVYFGEALQNQHPDWIYDDRGNCLYYTVTEDGYSYEVRRTYNSSDIWVTEELLGPDGSRVYTERGQTDHGWGDIYVERSGRFCQEDDVVRMIYDHRSGMHHYETYYKDGTIMICDDTANGNPHYSAYYYSDGRKEIYEYDEGVLTYMYIECEDGSVIEKGTPRG